MSDEVVSEITLPAAGAMSPPAIPERHSSKRKAVETIEELEAQQRKLSKTIKESKQRLSRNDSYDAEYVNFPELKKSILISDLATGWPTAISLTSKLPELGSNERYQSKAVLGVLQSRQQPGTKPKLQLIPSRKKVPSTRKKGCCLNRLNG